uniref:Dirigent protein n=1 Tax=Elaeis guineensis var. tenera TaxID=51953 RepID=A0A8N4EU56_ELAGV|nr:disease resistance response protein 206-like [Elaeis guineensis]
MPLLPPLTLLSGQEPKKLSALHPYKNLVFYFHDIRYNGQNAANATSAIKEVDTAWLVFTFVFNSTELKGTMNFLGADPITNKTRDIPVVGGMGDCFMTRGIATLMTDAFEGGIYFCLRVDINLYECY